MNPNAGPPVLYVGVETPISLFIGDQTTDELTVVWLALTALLVTWLLVLLFVNRFVRRPVAQLSRGRRPHRRGRLRLRHPGAVPRRAGVLARQVNQMRAQIESNIRHVDAAVSRLDEVSRALTTTTAGVSSLESAVCAAAASLAGPRCRGRCSSPARATGWWSAPGATPASTRPADRMHGPAPDGRRDRPQLRRWWPTCWRGAPPA